MLVLTRRIGETLVIGDEETITVTVLGVKGNQAKIGINAPLGYPRSPRRDFSADSS